MNKKMLHYGMERRCPVKAALTYGIAACVLVWLVLGLVSLVLDYRELERRAEHAEAVMQLAVAERDLVLSWAIMGRPTAEEEASLRSVRWF